MAERLLKQFENELEWQINRRALIQELLHDLLLFLDKHSEFPDEADENWIIVSWMMDCGFSLWRSAFLTDTPRDRRIASGLSVRNDRPGRQDR